MAKNKNLTSVTLSEEQAAALLEQARESATISPSGLKRVNRVHEIKAILAPFEAEIEEHKAAIFKEMDKKGVNVLKNRKGVEVVSRDEMTQEQWDRDGLRAEFPEVIAAFVVQITRFRINWKKPTI